MDKSKVTDCAISRLGFIPVMGGEMVESVEDVLVGHVGQAGWRIRPGDKSGGRGGHDLIGG